MNKKKNKTDFFDFDVRYDQEKDKHETINTDSVLSKKENPIRQFYTGLYYQKCYHNTGRYKWVNGDQEYVYEGKLYANDLHGYGRLVYPDNSTYEGLFFHNKRFGPGVVTYSEGLQDVGLWDGKYLVRLSQNIDLTGCILDTIPIIGKTVAGKLFLLKYKKIVPITDENDPVANLVKKFKLNADESQLLYSKCVRNYKSIFMNRAKFDKNFYTDPKELIVDVVDHFDENDDPVMSKIDVTNLIAWSNEKMFINIMKHAFMNRKYEKVISYKIRNCFLPNRRDTFMNEGPIEELCLKLLVACREDDTVNISKLISDYDLCPNVSDCFGNTTMIYAAMANKRNAIKALVNLGANINVVNDECVSALSLCILNYLAIRNDILEENWETAFLKVDESSLTLNGRVWPTGSNSSFESELKDSNSSKTTTETISTVKTKKQKKRLRKISTINRTYVFNLIYKQPKKTTISNRLKRLRKKLKLSLIYRKTIKCDKNIVLDDVMKTIQTLIECGADLNDCDVPFPPLISALFCDNVKMIEMLMESNVDVNQTTRTDSGGLNALQIVCAQENSKNQEVIMDILIKHGADVNARSDISHWPEARDTILAGEPLKFDEIEGKTAFHVLAMRYDFEEDKENRIVNIAKMLVKDGARASEQYLGHNALSLAALRGNAGLMEYILNNSLCDPNESLGYNMGVPLTMLTLRRYSKFLIPQNKIETMFDILVKNNANPFNELSNFDGNALEFAETTDLQGHFTSKDNVGLKMLKKISADILRRYIDGRALHFIYECIIHNKQYNSTIANAVVKYLDFEKAHRILQIFLDNNIIPPYFNVCMKLLSYVNSRTSKNKLKIRFIDKPEISKSDINKNKSSEKSKAKTFDITKSLVQIEEKSNVYELDFYKNEDEIVKPYKENMPEIDQNHEKYKVCFECLKRVDKHLQLCPICNLVYFCSVICNEKKNKSGEHPCKTIFYKTSQRSLLEKPSKKSRKDKNKKLKTRHVTRVSDASDDQDDDDSYTSSSYMYDSDDSGSSLTLKRRHKRKNKNKNKKKKRKRSTIISNLKSNKWYSFSTVDTAVIVLKRKRKICTATCNGKLIAIDFKESLKDVEMKMRRKFKAPELKHLRRKVLSTKLKRKFTFDEQNIDLMLRVAKRHNLQLIPILDSEQIYNPCDPFDYKFWQLFMPYCVLQNGDLFYRANDDSDVHYKLPYKHI